MKIDFRIDKRTELLGVLQLIGEYGKVYPDLQEDWDNKEYINPIINTFSKYKNEKAVKLFNRIINELNFGYDAPPCLFLQLNEDFTYSNLDEYPFKTRLYENPLVIEFLEELPYFAKKIKFDDFYNNRKSYYNSILEKEMTNLDCSSVVEFMIQFYKIDFSDNEFIVNLLPHTTNGNFGFNTHNSSKIYCCIGLANYEKSFSFTDDSTRMLMLHEFSHSIVNPLTDEYSDIHYDCFKDIEEVMYNMGYNIANVIIDEYIIRCIELIYLKHYAKDKKTYKDVLNLEIKHGFIDSAKYVEILEEYVNNIQNYKNFREFFPTLIKKLHNFYKEKQSNIVKIKTL